MPQRARREPSRTRGRVVWPLLVGAALVLATASGARADHSLGYGCITCHSLRSTNVVSGTRNIQRTLIENIFPYQLNWYCPTSSDPLSPRNTLEGIFAGGTPLDCSYCHGTGIDIGAEINNASNLTTSSSTASAHPVDTKGSNKRWGAQRISCNQCHSLDVSPQALCTKGTGNGYPNHLNLSAVPDATGTNQRTGTAAHLRGEYGPTAGSNWTVTAGVLCFDPGYAGGSGCHQAGGLSSFDVKADYDKVNGGHNIVSLDSAPATAGNLAKKLPCYDCHDPHGVATNAKLIIEDKVGVTDAAKENPYGTSYSATNLPPSGYTGSNDRVVCYGCHKGSAVEAVALPDVLDTNWAPTAFPFHANVHKAKDGSDPWQPASGNCLQKNGGCHQGPHDTDLFRCLDCHSKAVTDAMTAAGKTVPSRLLGTNHVDSEFGNVGAILGNGVKSTHTIVYDSTLDMSQAANNGCMACHDTRGAGAGSIVKGPGDAAKAKFGGSTREQLNSLDSFCLSCHDGAGTNFGAMVPPNVGDYFLSDGHGLQTGSYDSGNAAGKIPCLECHLYHGSTAYKLLPGDAPTADARGNVVKRDGGSTTGTKFTIGKLPDSTKIDYTDYTVDTYSDYGLGTKKANELLPSNFAYRAWYVSDYTQLWTTYSDDTNLAPSGAVTTPFGTSGALRNYNSDNFELECGHDAGQASWGSTEKIGLCNACHLYSDSTDGTTATYGKAYNHEGVVPGTTCSGGKDLKSQKKFFKDCAECHDPHGSGKRGGTGPNLYMMRGKIKQGATSALSDVTSDSNWSRIEFTAKTGPNSYDESDSSNADDLCAVCHVNAGTQSDPNVPNVAHNYLGQTTASHQEGNNCMVCHNHSSGLVRNPATEKNVAAVAFGLASTCTGCHGLPPIPLDDVTRVDAAESLAGTVDTCASLDASTSNYRCENYPGGGGAHFRHVEFLRSKLSLAVGEYRDSLCIPCHGTGPGAETWHDQSGAPCGWNWPSPTGAAAGYWQQAIDLRGDPANFGATATYNGAALPAKGGEPQQCQNLSCHGPGAPYNATPFAPTADYTNGFSRFNAAYPRRMRLLWDFNTPSYATDSAVAPVAACGTAAWTTTTYPAAWSVFDTWGRDIACAGCHASRGVTGGEPATTIAAGSYTSALGAQGVTANYFGTVSNYSRGGHGDGAIQNEDPFVNSDPGVGADHATPLRCGACHDDTLAHFPEGGNLYRLANTTLENDTHTGGLCNSCHLGSSYPGTGSDRSHHPSYYGPSGAQPTAHAIEPASGQEVMTAIGGTTTWTEQPPPGSLHYEQNAYGAGGQGLPGNVDWGLDWWAGAPGVARSPQPRPVFYGETQAATPKASLPLEQYVLGTGTSNRMMCVTCHNPHGTDLYVHDAGGIGGSISDNNMLRLRDEDNTLCNACH